MPIDSTPVMQICIIVDDIEKCAGNYARLFDMSVPKIFNIPDFKDTPAFQRGEPVDTSGCRICKFGVGNTFLELIEPDMTHPNPWKEWYDKNGGPGVQHIGFTVRDRASALETLEGMGAEIYHVGYYPNLTYTFADSLKQLGVEVNVEIYGVDNRELISKVLKDPGMRPDEING